MMVDENSDSIVTEREGKQYYFCSKHCKTSFENDPKNMFNSIRIRVVVPIPMNPLMVQKTKHRSIHRL